MVDSLYFSLKDDHKEIFMLLYNHHMCNKIYKYKYLAKCICKPNKYKYYIHEILRNHKLLFSNIYLLLLTKNQMMNDCLLSFLPGELIDIIVYNIISNFIKTYK
jgi:hypothetical protein